MSQPQERCKACWRETSGCICELIQPLSHRFQVLVLQHPKEAKNPLGSARVLSLLLKDSVHKVGLSWRSLGAAFGKPTPPSDWAVLYVGTKTNQKAVGTDPMIVLDRKGVPRAKQGIKGIVLLDGNWEQSKTLWWRNAWLTKLNRLVLNPELPSLYTGIRKAPRKGLVSTLEAAAICLEGFGENENVPKTLISTFAQVLQTVPKRPNIP